MTSTLFWLWAGTQVAGFALASYGLLRESFASLAQSRAYGEGRFGEGSHGGRPSKTAEAIVRIGLIMRLLPRDESLTLEDHRRNAAAAILGILLLALSMVFDIILGLQP